MANVRTEGIYKSRDETMLVFMTLFVYIYGLKQLDIWFISTLLLMIIPERGNPGGRGHMQRGGLSAV